MTSIAAPADCPCRCGRVLEPEDYDTATLAYTMLLTYRTLDSFDLAGRHADLVEHGETYASTLIRAAHHLPVGSHIEEFTSDDLTGWLDAATDAIGSFEPFGEDNTEDPGLETDENGESGDDEMVNAGDEREAATDTIIELIDEGISPDSPEDDEVEVDVEQADAGDTPEGEPDSEEDSDLGSNGTGNENRVENGNENSEIWNPYPDHKPKRRRSRLWGSSSRA